MPLEDLVKLGYGVLLGVVTFFLKRTVTVLDKLEARSEKHDNRLVKLETLAGIQRHDSGG